MTTSVSELMADEWNQTHPYAVEVVCGCREAWMVSYLAGEPLCPESMRCSVCSEEGVPQ